MGRVCIRKKKTGINIVTCSLVPIPRSYETASYPCQKLMLLFDCRTMVQM